jgi:hypothetical protein
MLTSFYVSKTLNLALNLWYTFVLWDQLEEIMEKFVKWFHLNAWRKADGVADFMNTVWIWK